MRFRSVLLAAAAVAVVVPNTAQATHCDNPIAVFSSTRVDTGVDNPAAPGTPIARTLPSVNPGAIGCLVIRDTVIGGEDPTLHPATETNFINPNANRMSVRLLNNGSDPTILSSATLTFAGDTYALTMAQGIDPVTGGPATFMDSQTFAIDAADTLVPNSAVVTFCFVDDPECISATYKTLAG